MLFHKFVIMRLKCIVFLFVCSEERIRNGCQKLKKGRKGATQGRLDNFFKVIPSNNNNKRKVRMSKQSVLVGKGNGSLGRERTVGLK